MDIFKDIPEKEYRSMKALNQSTLKMIFQSKAHFLMKHNDKKKTAAMIFGSAFHDFLFMGDEYFHNHYEVCGHNERQKDKAKDRIKEVEFNIIKGMVSHLNQYSIGVELDNYIKERTIVWEMRGMKCKAKIDLVDIEKREVIDLKTFARMDELKKPSDEIFWSILKRKYNFQAAFYLMGLKALTGEDWTYKFIFIEKNAPYQFCYVELPPELLEKGERDVRFAMDVMSSPFDPCGEENYPKDGSMLKMPENFKIKDV